MAQEAITFVTEAEIAEGERLLDKPLADCSLTEKLILSIIENHPEYDPSEPSFGQPSCPDCNYELSFATEVGFAPIFPDTCYHLTHYWLAAVDIPVASDNPVHYADAIRYNARTPLQGSLLPLTRLVWA